MNNGWEEIMRGAELRVPRLFYFIIKYVTPLFLLIILVGYVFKPAAGWQPYVQAPFTGEPVPVWEWAGDGMIGKLLHNDLPLKPDATEAEREFNAKMKLVRTVDRLVLVGVFLFFSFLVYRAWQQRYAEGRA
jgi:NSS family neurotransmitter:Na+ symporter